MTNNPKITARPMNRYARHCMLVVMVALVPAAGLAQQKPWEAAPFVFKDRCVPYEITPEFMRISGVDPDMILSSFPGDVPPDDGTGNGGTPAPWTWDLDDDGNPVPCDEFHTHRRRVHRKRGTP